MPDLLLTKQNLKPMDKYYHRGNGEVVKPEDPNPPKTGGYDPEWSEWKAAFVSTAPIYAYCDPSNPVGWIEGEEVYQILIIHSPLPYIDEWVFCPKENYETYSYDRRRIWIEPKREQPHKCQYCGATTTQHDDQCWNNPKNFKYTEGEDDVANDFHKANQPDFQREADELYPHIATYSKAFTLTERAAHIKARQMSEQEIRELREENERLKAVIHQNYKSWHIQFYRATSDLTAREIDDMFKERYAKFKSENNL